MSRVEAPPSECQIAWAAGLFEGEGCLHIEAQRFSQPFGHICASLASTDRDVVERFVRIIGVGSVARFKTPPGNKPAWRWSVRSGKAEEVIRLLMPYFGERRFAKARELLDQRKLYVETVTAPRRCQHCGAMFSPPLSKNTFNYRYCSERCRQDNRNMRRRKVAGCV